MGAYQIETTFLRSEGRQIQEELEWILEPTFQLLWRSCLTREGTKPMWRRGTTMVWKGTMAGMVTGMEEESRGEGRGVAAEESRGE